MTEILSRIAIQMLGSVDWRIRELTSDVIIVMQNACSRQALFIKRPLTNDCLVGKLQIKGHIERIFLNLHCFVC